jgi:hypothetical protein
MTRRVTVARVQRVDICDEAFALKPVAPMARRTTVARSQRVDICDKAFALKPLPR